MDVETKHEKALDDGTGGIDETLYSRQLITLGAKVMLRMAKAKVFISGMDALGVEIAKNVALAGVKKLTVHDIKVAKPLDLTNYYLTATNVSNGDNRAVASALKLNELNRYTPVDSSTTDLETANLEDFFSVKEGEEDSLAYSVVVLVDQPTQLVSKVDAYCHKHGIKFIYAKSVGFFGLIFNDFGPHFVVDDPAGLDMIEFQLKVIRKGEEFKTENGEEWVKLIVEGVPETDLEPKKLHGLNDGDAVQLSGTSYPALHDKTHSVNKVNAHEFYIVIGKAIADSIGGEGVRGGFCKQVLVPLDMQYQTWDEQVNSPTLDDFNVDWNKGDFRILMIQSVKALETFKKEHGDLPRPWNKEDADKFVEIVKRQCPESLDESQVAFLTKVSFTSRGRLVGNDSVLGGFIAQEVVKAIGQKYTPTKQWFFHEAMELLPPIESFDSSHFQEKGDRYDSLRVVLGDNVVQKLRETSLFMIGCGAIGCELMKMYAMLGIATSPESLITVTDNDFIEKSNLNRKEDLDQPKSETAGKAILSMNPDIRVKSYTSLVSKETEGTFSDDFFKQQTLIVNALDNVEARLYVDSRCVDTRKPLLESGTKGPLGHTMSIIPDLTVNYGFTRDPPDQDFAGCTVKYFPFKSVHAIQWAKQKFQKHFEHMPHECNRVREDSKGAGWWDRLRAMQPRPSPADFKRWTKLLSTNLTTSEQCIQYAKKTFVSWFRNFVIQLLHNYPLDSKDKEGKLFWAPPKKIPSVIEFDSSNDIHMNFVQNLASLIAFAHKVNEPAPSREEAKKIVDTYHIPDYVIKTNKQIIDDATLSKEELEAKKKEKEERWETEESFENAIQEMKKWAQLETVMQPDKFEKDVDANHHIDFIFACSNIRCIQYGIEDRLQTKSIAGRIIPAMATTTACVSGLVGNELIKVVTGAKNIETYRNGFIDLARPALVFFDPGQAPKEKITEKLSVTLWDKKWVWNQGNKPLGQFVRHYKNEYGLLLSELVFAGEAVYMPEIISDHKKLLPNRLRNILASAGLSEAATYADVACHWSYTNPDGEDKEFENKIRIFF